MVGLWIRTGFRDPQEVPKSPGKCTASVDPFLGTSNCHLHTRVYTPAADVVPSNLIFFSVPILFPYRTLVTNVLIRAGSPIVTNACLLVGLPD